MMASSAVLRSLCARRSFLISRTLDTSKTISSEPWKTSSLKFKEWPSFTVEVQFMSTNPLRPKTVPKVQITLVNTDEKVSIVLLEEAQKIAKRRNLHLLKVSDPDVKSNRATYRLLSLSEIERSSPSSTIKTKTTPDFKGEKHVIVTSKINQHDIEFRLKQIHKWIQKNFEVKVMVNGNADDISSSERVSQILEKSVCELGARIVQKRSKDGNIKFQILPAKVQLENKDDQ